METEIVQRFLESVGAKADIDLYLKLFRAQRKESFAILAPNAQIVKSALDPVHFDLRILAGLGLVPVVVLGLLEPKDADAQASRVSDWLLEDAVRVRGAARQRRPGRRFAADSVAAMRATIGARRDPTRVAGGGARTLPTEARFRLLASLAASLETRKVVFLSRRPGLAPNGAAPLSVVSLATDSERLLAPGGGLSRGQAMLLRQVKQLLEGVPHRLSVTVVNPLQLLRELFTVNGAGTLIRRGSRIDAARRLGRRRPGAHHGAVRVGVRTPAAARVLRPAGGARLRRGRLPRRRGHAGDAGRALPDQVRRRAVGAGRRHRRRAVVAGDARLPALLLAVARRQRDHAVVREAVRRVGAFSRMARVLARPGDRDHRSRHPLRARRAQRLRELTPDAIAYFAGHSVASGPPAPRTGSPPGSATRAMLRSAPGRSPGLPYCMSGLVPAG